MKTNKKEKLPPRKSQRGREDCIDKLIVEKCLNSDETFFNYFKVTPNQYKHLHSLIETRIKKKDVNSNDTLTSKDRLAVTLRYLAGGDLMKEILTSFQIGKLAVSDVIIETCEAITDVLQPLVLVKPTTEKWLDIAQEFSKLWQIPHCLGAIDIKRFEMQVASGMGWTCCNRKGTCALTLLAVADSHYNFVLVDAGAPGHLYDKAILENSNIGHQLQHGLLSIPPPELIPETNILMPYSFIGDEGFPLQENLMRPYQGSNLSEGQKTFNYKLSQARQCIENTFAILSSHFRVFQRPISAQVEMAVAAVEAATCLHNYIIMSESSVPPSKRFYGTSKVRNTSMPTKSEDDARTCGDEISNDLRY